MGKFFKEQQNNLPVLRIAEDLIDDQLMIDDKGEAWCCCPLHPERTPSFSIQINPDSKKYGLWFCFACGGGDLVQLVSAINHISYTEAESYLENNYLNLNSEWDKNELLSLLERIDRIQEQKQEDEMPEYPNLFPMEKHPWMYEQGLSDDAIDHFQITYNKDKDSVMFPHWWGGKLVGWQARDLSGTSRAKYMSTPNFPKRNTLYHYCNDCLGDGVIVVESPKTAAIMWSRGFKNVVATFGASINEEQMAPLWRFPHVFLWFDNDEAGAKARSSAIQLLKDSTEVYVVPPVNVPKGDPADIPAEEMMDYLNRAVYYANWRE